MRKKLLVIVGPTGSGKTAFAIKLAKHLETEIISADSRQVFKEMKIGSAQPEADELMAIPHHLIGHKRIYDEYNAAIFAKEAKSLLNHLFEKKNSLILCGGSGLYIKALLEGLDEIPEIPDSVSKEVQLQYQKNGIEWLRKEVEAIDPIWYSKADQSNPRRLLRCLEVYRFTGQPLSAFQKQLNNLNHWETIKIGLERSRTKLYQLIDNRVMKMVEAGLFEEAKGLYEAKHLRALQTVGYSEIFDHFDGLYTREEAISKIQQHTRNYAKRQMTWFKKDKSIQWINPENSSSANEIIASINH